jgi:hypothetical protein
MTEAQPLCLQHSFTAPCPYCQRDALAADLAQLSEKACAAVLAYRAALNKLTDSFKYSTEVVTIARTALATPQETPEEHQIDQAPIARLTVTESGVGSMMYVSAAMYAPGLPPGEHDVYCEPTSKIRGES